MTTPGLLADLGLDTVDSDPNNFPDGTYDAYLTKVVRQAHKDTTKGYSLVFTYRIDGGAHDGKTIDEWKSANPSDDTQKKSYLKQRIMSLGVPETRVGSFVAEDIIGTAVTITKKQNGDFKNVTSVRVRGDVKDLSLSGAAPAAPVTPQAAVLGQL